MYSWPCLGALCHTPPGPSFFEALWIRLVQHHLWLLARIFVGIFRFRQRLCAASAPEALVPIQQYSQQAASSSKPPAVSGSLHLPPIPRFHFGSSHGQQVIGIDEAEGVAGGASLPSLHSISHVPLENVLGGRCVDCSAPQVDMGYCIRHQCLSKDCMIR